MVTISSHVTPPLRSLMARIVPPAVSRTQEILSRVCMCTNVRQKESEKRREKLQLTGWHRALPLLGLGLCLGASHLSRGKSAAEIGSLEWQQCGEVKRKLKNSSYIIGFMQPFISSRHHLNVGSRQHVVIRKENAHTHLLSASKHTLQSRVVDGCELPALVAHKEKA